MLLVLITRAFNGTLEPPFCVLFVIVGPGWLIISPQQQAGNEVARAVKISVAGRHEVMVSTRGRRLRNGRF